MDIDMDVDIDVDIDIDVDKDMDIDIDRYKELLQSLFLSIYQSIFLLNGCFHLYLSILIVSLSLTLSG